MTAPVRRTTRYESLRTSRQVLARMGPLVRFGLWALGVSVFLGQVRPMLSDAQIIVGFQSLVAAIQDAHTDVGWSYPRPFQLVPLSFYWFDEGIYVTGAPAQYRSDRASHRQACFFRYLHHHDQRRRTYAPSEYL